MAMWLTLHDVVPLGVIAIAAVFAIYHAFAYPPPHLTTTSGTSGGVNTAGSQQLGWIR